MCLPVRASVNPDATFEDHLKSARKRLLDAFDHQSLSFGALVRSLNLPRDPSRTPLVTATFNSDNVTAPFHFHSVEAELLSSPKKFATFDLEFNILKTATRYSRNAFTAPPSCNRLPSSAGWKTMRRCWHRSARTPRKKLPTWL